MPLRLTLTAVTTHCRYGAVLAGVSSLMFVAFTVYGVIKFYAVRFCVPRRLPRSAGVTLPPVPLSTSTTSSPPLTTRRPPHDRTYKKTKDARRDALTKVFTRWRVQRELEKDRRIEETLREEELMEILEKLVTA